MAHAAKTLFAVAVALFGCNAEEPQPPDPDTPLPPVVCDDTAPLTLLRTAPDSALGRPPWLELCNVCPATFDLQVDDVELLTARADGGACALAMPTLPWPARDTYAVASTITTATRSATFDFDAVGTGARGDDPADLGSATYRLPVDADALRVPDAGLEPTGGDLLVRFEATADHGLAVRFGRTRSDSNQQDLCAPTTTLSTSARLDRRQIAAPLVEGDVVPLPFAGPASRGAVQATLSSTGSALSAMALLLEVDARQLGDDPDAVCADYEALGAGPLCGPCGDAAGPSESDTCIAFLWEWSTAVRVPSALVPVDVPAPDCLDNP
jgi:hypothetical protein